MIGIVEAVTTVRLLNFGNANVLEALLGAARHGVTGGVEAMTVVTRFKSGTTALKVVLLLLNQWSQYRNGDSANSTSVKAAKAVEM